GGARPRRIHRGRGAGRRAAAPAAHHHDCARLHSRCRPAPHRNRVRGGGAAHSRHRRVRWHARCHADRHLLRPRDVLREPASGGRPASARDTAGASRGRCARGRSVVARFFVDRPIVAIVISILLVLLGVVAALQLPVSLYPNIAPPEIVVQATYVGADALTIEQAVATPVEAQMTGVDNMLYMYSTSTTSGGQMNLRVVFDVTTDPGTDQVLAQMRYSQAAAQLPPPVTTQGVTVKQSAASPLVLFALYSPKGSHDPLFVSNYAYININDPMTRVPGVGQGQISGAGQYAMRRWVRPRPLASLEIPANDIVNAIQAQNTANASGQVGGNPAPPGQQFTYTVRAPGRLDTPAAFGDIVVRARPDGSVVRVKDVARVEL